MLIEFQRAFQIVRKIMDHAAGDVSVVRHRGLVAAEFRSRNGWNADADA